MVKFRITLFWRDTIGIIHHCTLVEPTIMVIWFRERFVVLLIKCRINNNNNNLYVRIDQSKPWSIICFIWRQRAWCISLWGVEKFGQVPLGSFAQWTSRVGCGEWWTPIWWHQTVHWACHDAWCNSYWKGTSRSWLPLCPIRWWRT